MTVKEAATMLEWAKWVISEDRKNEDGGAIIRTTLFQFQNVNLANYYVWHRADMVMLRMLKGGEIMIDLSKIKDNRLRQEVVAWTEKLEERITILKSQFQIADSDAYYKCSNKRYMRDRRDSISLLISNEKGRYLFGLFFSLSFVALIVLIALYSGEWWKLLLELVRLTIS